MDLKATLRDLAPRLRREYERMLAPGKGSPKGHMLTRTPNPNPNPITLTLTLTLILTLTRQGQPQWAHERPPQRLSGPGWRC